MINDKYINNNYINILIINHNKYINKKLKKNENKK